MDLEIAEIDERLASLLGNDKTRYDDARALHEHMKETIAKLDPDEAACEALLAQANIRGQSARRGRSQIDKSPRRLYDYCPPGVSELLPGSNSRGELNRTTIRNRRLRQQEIDLQNDRLCKRLENAKSVIKGSMGTGTSLSRGEVPRAPTGDPKPIFRNRKGGATPRSMSRMEEEWEIVI
uniref:Uncharacterized protein n=1 Tax=Oxyrrhis marina TaxID=2969 RepID=A0A7S3XHT8_OXYMA